jgi:hypothetical protein
MFCLSTFLALSVPNVDYSVNVLPFILLALSVSNVDYSVNVLPFNLLALSVPNVDYSVNVLPFNLFGFERTQCRLFRKCFAFQPFWL